MPINFELPITKLPFVWPDTPLPRAQLLPEPPRRGPLPQRQLLPARPLLPRQPRLPRPLLEELLQAALLQAAAAAGQGPGGERAHQLPAAAARPEAAVEGDGPREAGAAGGGGQGPAQRQGPRRLGARLPRHHPDGLYQDARKCGCLTFIVEVFAFC